GNGSDSEEKTEAKSESKSEAQVENAQTDSKAQKGAGNQEAQKTEVPAGKETASTTEGGRVKASPLAKKVAQDKGYNLSEIRGSGDNGRIVLRDVENYKPAAKPAQATSAAQPATSTTPVGEPGQEIPVSQMRKIIA